MNNKYAAFTGVLGAACYLLGLMLAQYTIGALIATLIVGLISSVIGSEFEKLP